MQLWLRRILAVPAGVAVGGFLVQFFDGVVGRAFMDAPMPDASASNPVPAMVTLQFIWTLVGNIAGSGIAGVVTAVVAADRRRVYVAVLSAIVLVLTYRTVGGEEISDGLRNQQWGLVVGSVVGCFGLGWLTSRFTDSRTR